MPESREPRRAELLSCRGASRESARQTGPGGLGRGMGSAERQPLTSAHAWLSGTGPYSSVVKISRALGFARVAAITRPGRFPPSSVGCSAQRNLEVEGRHRPLQFRGRGYERVRA